MFRRTLQTNQQRVRISAKYFVIFLYEIISVMTHDLICYVLCFYAIFVVMNCDLFCDSSTKQYPLNGKNRLHILNNREAYYYYYYYYWAISKNPIKSKI